MGAYSGDKKSCYAYAPGDQKSDWKLPICGENGELDAGIIGAAAAAVGPGFRGNKASLPSGSVSGVKRRIRSAWKKVHPDSDESEMPEGIQLSEIAQTQSTEMWFAERSLLGFLVALWLDSDTAAKLAIPKGEPANQLHITLVLCGEDDGLDELTKALIITEVNNIVRYRTRLEGKISGYGRFIAGEEGDQDVFYATPDIPALAGLRQEIFNCLLNHGVPVSTDHGYTPHITLAYLDPGENNPLSEIEDTSLYFDSVTIMDGGRRVDIPFYRPDPAIEMMIYGELPPEAPIDVHQARALYFGSFNKEWIPFLPKPDKYIHEVYGNLDFTTDVYKEILKNFDDYVYKQDLPIRATHTAPEAGAVGWIRPGGMRFAKDGSLEVKPEWNELGKGLVEDDRFLYTSAEYCKVWTNPVTQEKIPNVAIGLALVTRPHFKTDVLAPLSEGEAQAFSEALSHGVSAVGGEGTPMSDSQLPNSVTAASIPVVTSQVAPLAPSAPATPQANPLDPNQSVVLSDLTQVVITAEQRRRERQLFADLESRVELAERRATTAEAELAKVREEQRTLKFTAEVLGRSPENGNPWFGDPKDNISHLVSLAEKYGDDSTEVRWAVTQKRNEAAAIRNTGLFDPISISTPEGASSLTAQVTQLAEQQRAADPKLTKDEAIIRVYKENPELYVRGLKR